VVVTEMTMKAAAVVMSGSDGGSGGAAAATVVVAMAATAKAVLVRVEELSASEMMELPRVRDTFDHPNECVTVSGHRVNK
jgi:hypothetical protein